MSTTEETSSHDKAIQAWQRVPPEERTLIISAAQAQAVGTCLVFLILGATSAFGLGMPAFLLATAVLLPLVFQTTFARSWNRVQPKTVAEYLAAEHTARYFAKNLQAPSTGVKFLFRANVEKPHDTPRSRGSEDDNKHQEPKRVPVWVSVFPESLLMIAESKEGAQLLFAHSTTARFRVSYNERNDEDQEPENLLVETEDKDGEESRWILTSPYPTTLATCEEKIRILSEQARSNNSEPRRSLALP